MKDEIKKQIEEVIKSPLTNYINDKHTQEECAGFIAGFNEGYKACYNIKESVDEKLLRQVQRLTTWLRIEGNDDDIKMILEAEEVMNEAESILSASQNTVSNEGEKYCSKCGNDERFKYNDQYANGEQWTCLDCDNTFFINPPKEK